MMAPLAAVSDLNMAFRVAMGCLAFVASMLVVLWAWRPLRAYLGRQEAMYDRVLRGSLLLDVNPRTVTWAGIGGVVLLALLGYAAIHHVLAALVGAIIGAVLPPVVVRYLKARRLYQLEDQLVDGIQTLVSGVRAGLNLTQAMDLLAKNGPAPISEEFGHLLREYEHGMSIERAMMASAARIGSTNYRLLFSALLTHRERGGDLGETLDRISESIREIHRLEKRIETLTAPGRAAARWMGAMPAVIVGILYFIDPFGVRMLFTEDVGKVLLFGIVLLNVIGFLWIRRIVAIDV